MKKVLSLIWHHLIMIAAARESYTRRVTRWY